MGFTLKEKKEEQKTEGQEGGGSSSLGGGRGKGRDPENQSLRSPHRGAWPAQWTLGSRGLRDGDREGLTRRAQLMRSSSLATTYSPRLLGSAAGLGTTALAWDTAGWVLDTWTHGMERRQPGRRPLCPHLLPRPGAGHASLQSHWDPVLSRTWSPQLENGFS